MKTVFTVILVIAAVAWGDKVYLNNGDVVSGKVKTMADGKLVVESELMGELKIDMANVKTFETEEEMPLHLSDGSVLNRKAAAAANAGQISTEGQIGTPQTVDIKDITRINPPAPEKPRWKGDIKGGWFYSSGNTSRDSYNLGFDINKNTEADRTRFNGDTVKSREKDDDGQKDTTEDWWKVAGKYDYFLNKKDYLYVNGEYKKDAIAELDRRVITGGGYGRKLVDTADLTLDAEAGLASVYEAYEGQDSTSDFSMRAAYMLFKKMTNTLTFHHGLEYYPTMDDFSDYYLSTNGEFRLAVTQSIFTSYKVILDYDASPARDSSSTDIKHLLSVGVSF